MAESLRTNPALWVNPIEVVNGAEVAILDDFGVVGLAEVTDQLMFNFGKINNSAIIM